MPGCKFSTETPIYGECPVGILAKGISKRTRVERLAGAAGRRQMCSKPVAGAGASDSKNLCPETFGSY